ncbi:MAG TPA: DUF4326 domain-containing protein [Xanthomonadales bacterium]|nr:DUF4326 domain-containing protein [Xanthomonadales bacterium]
MPRRVRLQRTRGWRLPPDTVVVARPTRWGNPFVVGTPGVADRAEAVRRYREYLARDDALARAARDQLRGRDLACWCPLDAPCHADALLELANG